MMYAVLSTTRAKMERERLRCGTPINRQLVLFCVVQPHSLDKELHLCIQVGGNLAKTPRGGVSAVQLVTLSGAPNDSV